MHTAITKMMAMTMMAMMAVMAMMKATKMMTVTLAPTIFRFKGYKMSEQTRKDKAWEKLARLTREYTNVSEACRLWDVLSSTAKQQANILKNCGAGSETVDWTATFGQVCNERAIKLGIWLNARFSEMTTLSDAIQSGAYDDEID